MQIARILHKLGKKIRHGKRLPHELTQRNKNDHLAAAQQLLQRQQERPFLNRIVTFDEKWILYKNFVNKKQWLTPGQPARQVPKPDWLAKKVLLCVWWWHGGMIHWELVPNGQTINSDRYCAQLDRVQRKLRSPDLAGHFRGGVVFQQDNARPHVSKATLQKIDQLGWECLVHPSYNPDCVPSDYHLFASLAHSLAGVQFANVDRIKNHLRLYFASKPPEFYARGIGPLPIKWQHMINHNGCYFEA